MCQSIAEGGRRCDTKLIGSSNYPHAVQFNDGKWVIDRNALLSNPDALVHSFIVSSRSGQPISEELRELLHENSHVWETMTPKSRWGLWKSTANLDNPSAVLQNLHYAGWERNFPELAAIRDVPQSPEWHPEGAVHVHIQQAGDVAARNATQEGLDSEQRQIAVFGAICHDFGKATDTQIAEDGSISSRGHDVAGAKPARSFLTRIGAPKKVVETVPTLVRYHMCHTNPNPTKKSLFKLVDGLERGGATLPQLARIIDADKGGRGSASGDAVGYRWLELHAEYSKVTERQSTANQVNGAYLRGLGVPQGPAYREIISAFRESGEGFDEEKTPLWVRNFLKSKK